MEEIMLIRIALYAVLIICAVGGMAFAPAVAAPAQKAEIDYAVVFRAPPPTAQTLGLSPEFLTSIVNWLAANFDLPATRELPRVEFAAPLKLVAMRYKGLMPHGWREDAIRDSAVQAAHQREVIAVYNDKTRTIFLPEGWTGARPAERSIVVHEMVHHLQNEANLKYECPAAREKLAYEAQSDWLKMQGLTLEAEFDVDLFTVFVLSACMN
jgi:hypothetical protein